MKQENETVRADTAELVKRAREGDRNAKEELYLATSQEVYRTIHAMVKNEDLTLDIQQDTYVSAFSRLDQLRDGAQFLPWVRQIAVNEARSALRKKTPLLFTELASEEYGDFPETPDVNPDNSPELALEQKETARLVQELLGELSDGQRLLVGMYYYEQIPVRQIAESLGVSEGTVKNQLFRSRKKVEAGVKKLEKQGVKLFGLAPMPFLAALLKNSSPAAEGSKAVLTKVMSETGASYAAIHVGRRFFETVLGRAVLGLITVGVIGGGVMGYRWWKDTNDRAREDLLHVRTTENLPAGEETDPAFADDSSEDLIPDQPPAIETGTEPTETDPAETDPAFFDDSLEDLVPDQPPETETGTEPEETDPPSTDPPAPPPTEPPTEPPAPTPTDPPTPTPPVGDGSPVPSDPAPTEPATEPTPSSPEVTEELIPQVVSCNWYRIGGPTTLYDQEWDSFQRIYVVTENDALPVLYTDDTNVISLQEEGRFYSMELEPGQELYSWRATFLGPGTGHVYCKLGDHITHVLTVENPEYPEQMIAAAVDCHVENASAADLENCSLDEYIFVYSFSQGRSKPTLFSDNPDVIEFSNTAGCMNQCFGSNRFGDTETCTDWIHLEFRWHSQIKGEGVAHISLVFNGVVEKVWTIRVSPTEPPADPPTEPSPSGEGVGAADG